MKRLGWFLDDLQVMPEDVTPATKLAVVLMVFGFVLLVLTLTAL